MLPFALTVLYRIRGKIQFSCPNGLDSLDGLLEFRGVNLLFASVIDSRLANWEFLTNAREPLYQNRLILPEHTFRSS